MISMKYTSRDYTNFRSSSREMSATQTNFVCSINCTFHPFFLYHQLDLIQSFIKLESATIMR